jgi:hypothetical protein
METKENKKQIVTDRIFSKIDYKRPVYFGEITVALQPNDVVKQNYVEPFYSENESWDGHYQLEVFRDREETDAEYEKRKKENEAYNVELRERRYQNYLKLKKEFEMIEPKLTLKEIEDEIEDIENNQK